jgi:hypothetical protein
MRFAHCRQTYTALLVVLDLVFGVALAPFVNASSGQRGLFASTPTTAIASSTQEEEEIKSIKSALNGSANGRAHIRRTVDDIRANRAPDHHHRFLPADPQAALLPGLVDDTAPRGPPLWRSPLRGPPIS